MRVSKIREGINKSSNGSSFSIDFQRRKIILINAFMFTDIFSASKVNQVKTISLHFEHKQIHIRIHA